MEAIIIIGTGMAAYTLAREFRKLDQATPLRLISSDDGRSYPKPMLSNALVKGKTADQIAMFDAKDMAKRLNAEILTHRLALKIEPKIHTIKLDDGSQQKYSKLVLALGAKPIVIPISGNAANDVLSINDLMDYTAFRECLVDAKHVALIGSGLVGCEFANDLVASSDVRVSIIGQDLLPMNNLLPAPVAEKLQQKLSDAGAEWHLGTTAESIYHNGNVYELKMSNGTTIAPDLIVSAVGLRANIELASNAGLNVKQGIVTDTFLKTNNDDIYALGDCAEVAGHNLLFVAPLLVAAKALAKTLAGDQTAVHYPAMPVTVKTTLYPLVIAPPTRGAQGEWALEYAQSGFGIKGLFYGADKSLLGFALSGEFVKEKQLLAKQLPDILA